MAKSLSAGARLLAFATEIPPAAYVLITGHAPAWIRIWFGLWLGIWLLSTVATAADAMAKQ
ncbi:hypothetical protein GCM10010193_69510 [Kitasatospora atroaurantiaca]|uniref:Uncharacterized protein n=1 Tax=Kitasatospora atroaurantiaca TaxID=285545 RepID=A0A561EN38_9ACTN|nr:hypothetical protein [Kitasatospora atroaurantiaca]TWE17038.1 hypothetical protein FB465_2042 [Kitasatospora atroaurantiaca]